MNKLDLNNFPIDSTIEWKFGLITRSVYRSSEHDFEIDDTSSGWKTAYVGLNEMVKLVNGKLSLIDLNWE